MAPLSAHQLSFFEGTAGSLVVGYVITTGWAQKQEGQNLMIWGAELLDAAIAALHSGSL